MTGPETREDELLSSLVDALVTLESIYSGEYTRGDMMEIAGDEAAEIRGALGLNVEDE